MDVQSVTFNLFIKDSGATSRNVLEFIRQNIKAIKRMGVTIEIVSLAPEGINRKLYASLASKGIKEFPALIVRPGKDPIVGFVKIRNIFKKNISDFNERAAGASRAEPSPNVSGVDDTDGDPTLSRFFLNEMNSGDQESEEGSMGSEAMEKSDFNSRMQQQMMKRKISPPGKAANSSGDGGGNYDDGGDGTDDMDSALAKRSTKRVTPSTANDQEERLDSMQGEHTGNRNNRNQNNVYSDGSDADAIFEAKYLQSASYDDGY